MAIIETEFRQFKQQYRKDIQELRALLLGKLSLGNWVKQEIACIMLNVKPRRLRDLRIHTDANGKFVGSIRYRKGNGKTVEYHKADLEKYLNKITVS